MRLLGTKADAAIKDVYSRGSVIGGESAELLGIGIDEPAAILVTGSQFEVIGRGRVAIYDNQKHGKTWYYELPIGSRFDLATRRQLR